ncbi:MAG: ABC transporter permease [Ilumatobacteraceae bacterium]
MSDLDVSPVAETSVAGSLALRGVDPVATSGRRTRTRIGRALLIIAPIVGIIAFLGLWELAIRVYDIKKFALSSPIDVIRHLSSDKRFYFDNARTTMWEALVGFVIAFVLAMIAATAMAQSRFLERAVLPLAVLVQVTPIIAYAPAIVIWQGFGFKPIVIMTSLVCFVPFLINGLTGLRSVDPGLIELARSVDASGLEVFFKLRLPSALPSVFSAARIAVGLSLIGAVLGEFFSGVSGGLGYAVKVGQARNLPLQIWGSVFTLAVIGATATLLITGLERLVLHWHSSQRQ